MAIELNPRKHSRVAIDSKPEFGTSRPKKNKTRRILPTTIVCIFLISVANRFFQDFKLQTSHQHLAKSFWETEGVQRLHVERKVNFHLTNNNSFGIQSEPQPRPLDHVVTNPSIQTEDNEIFYYHKFWNFTTHSIHIPNKQPGGKITSLEILQSIIDDPSKEVGDLLEERLPKCLIPNSQKTQKLLDRLQPVGSLQTSLPLPILNVGMPKCGSTTLHGFFSCAGLRATHGQDGPCMAGAVVKGKPPISGCTFTRGKTALSQLDRNFPPDRCWYPQVSFLDEIHKEAPNATFVLNFRPVDDWIQSARNHDTLVERWNICKSNIPGLIQRSIIGHLSQDDLRQWFCHHVYHIRQFVKQYPSHTLIELDLYNRSETSKVMSKLFNADPSCWGKENVNISLERKRNATVE